jgi:hypothetical protein
MDFLSGGETTARQKASASSRKHCMQVISQREKPFDPIAVSRLDQKEISLRALCASVVKGFLSFDIDLA